MLISIVVQSKPNITSNNVTTNKVRRNSLAHKKFETHTCFFLFPTQPCFNSSPNQIKERERENEMRN